MPLHGRDLVRKLTQSDNNELPASALLLFSDEISACRQGDLLIKCSVVKCATALKLRFPSAVVGVGRI